MKVLVKKNMQKLIQKNKYILALIFISFSISIIWSHYNLNKFDNIKVNFENKHYNPLLYADLAGTWDTANNFKEQLDQGKDFFSSIPSYERFLLPSIIVGYYYHLIDRDIYEIKENNQFVIKEKNKKIFLLYFQIVLFYLSILLIFNQLVLKFGNLRAKLIVTFLCLEPSLLQWHSSFWSESIFFSMMILVFCLLIKSSDKVIFNLLIGLIIGLMFMQRSVSFFYIVPILLFIILNFKKKLKPFFFVLIGYFLITGSVGYNNYNKTGTLYFLPTTMTYYGYFHYFADDILANRQKISKAKAREILLNEENIWKKSNDIKLENMKDLQKNISFRNKIFIREVLKNPIFSIQLFLRRTIKMSIIDPFWVNSHFYSDKTDPKAKNDPKSYYNKNLIYKVPYALIINLFSLFGLILIMKNIVIKKKFDFVHKFYLFNVISIFYFISIAGFWGNFKYFVPCLINMSFFFTEGLLFFFRKYYLKNE